MRKLIGFFTVCGAVFAAIAGVLGWKEAKSMGLVGKSEGSTAVYVAGRPVFPTLAALGATVAAVGSLLLFVTRGRR